MAGEAPVDQMSRISVSVSEHIFQAISHSQYTTKTYDSINSCMASHEGHVYKPYLIIHASRSVMFQRDIPVAIVALLHARRFILDRKKNCLNFLNMCLKRSNFGFT